MYESSRKMMLKRNPANTSIEYNLFHGTLTDSIESICRFGFNRSYCGKNGVAFGQGVYFARDALYSDRYSRMCNPHQNANFNFIANKGCSMILARVLVGIFQKGTPQMKDPERRNDGNQFDSTVDDVSHPTIFVIYRDYRAYPNYIIHYT